MSSTHAQDWLNFTFPTASLTVGQASTPAYTQGMAFSVTESCFCDALAWYRPVANSLHAPVALKLYRADTQTLVAAAPTVADDGAVGWQDCALSAPVPLFAGVRYKVAADLPVGGYDVGCVVAGLPLPGLGFNWSPIVTGYKSTAGYGYPNFDDTNGFIRGLDARKMVGDPGIDTGLTNALDSWLVAGSENAHKDTDSRPGLPYIIGVDVATIRGDVADIVVAEEGLDTKVGSASGLDFPSLFAGIDELWERTATLLTGSATLLARVPSTIGASIAHLIGQSTGTEGSAVGALSGRTGFPTVLWTMADTVDFVQAKSWDVPADLYTLSTSDWPVNIRQTLVDGAPWRPRLGWWAPRNGDLIGQRRFIDWENSILEDGGRRMPGVVVWLEPNTAGTLEAWRLT